MDNLRIDSHKLMYHVSRVSKWLEGENIYPIYVEIAPSGACNHRCVFCALEYLDYRPHFLRTDVLLDVISEMARKEVKGVMYAGEGEPLLHKDIGRIVRHTADAGIDVSITTNGVLLDRCMDKEFLAALSWMRVSLNAGTNMTYAKVHRSPASDFDKVLRNLSDAVELKKRNRLACTIGVQFLLLPQNYQEATVLAERLRDVGVDFLTIKPFSQHPLSSSTIDKDFDYGRYRYLEEQLLKMANGQLKILFRAHTMQKLKDDRPYERCLGLPFFTYIDAAGNVYACSAFLGDERFCYGNVYENSFSEIWEGERRKQVLNYVDTELDVSQCRKACRLDEINRYLWELKCPHPHVNFI